MFKSITYLFVCVLLIVACKKNETIAPVIEIYAPKANDSFTVADSFRINFSIKDERLVSYKIIIFNKLTNKIYINEVGDATTSNFIFDEKRYINVQTDTSVYMNILGIDANGNTGKNGVAFKLKR